MTEQERQRWLVQAVGALGTTVLTASIFFAATYFFNDNAEKAATRATYEVMAKQLVELRADVKQLLNERVTRAELRELEARMLVVERRMK